jgi:CRISPR-associated endonuclease Csy4
MKYYQEIILLPPADISLYFLWQKVYQQIHIGFAENKNPDDTSSIGISFPEYDSINFLLGKKMLLLARDEIILNALNASRWLERLNDYLSVSLIKTVPENVKGYACFKHCKLKGNKEKLARRRAKRKGETYEQALSFYSGYQAKEIKLPYINMQSQTNGEHFRIYIKKEKKTQPKAGFFSCYGLSNEATVPLF